GPPEGDPDPDFAEVFLGEQPARFGYLYPTGGFSADAAGADAFPFPLTARTCKVGKGFQGKGHGIFDLLLPRLRAAAQTPAAAEAAAPTPVSCPRCRERLEPVRGTAARADNAADGYLNVQLSKRPFVRVGLNRRTETAEEQILYVIEALIPDGRNPLTFIGSCFLSEAQRRAFERLAERFIVREE